MDALVLLSLTAFICLLTYLAFRGVLVPTVHRRQGIINGSEVVREKADTEKSANRHGRHTRIFIPNVLAGWPWPERINPNYAVVKEEASTWFQSFKPFNPKAQDAFNRCKFNLLACLAYPTARKEHVRAGCDIMNLIFLFDECFEKSTPSRARYQKDVILDAIRNPHTPRPQGEWLCGEMARQFWERTIQNATEISQKRFIQNLEDYLEGVVQESIDKKDGHILDIKTYIEVRRRTIGGRHAFSILELGLDIPDDVMSHPVIRDVTLAAIDLIAFSNDIFSYNLEQMLGDDLHNIITCVMKEYDMDVNGAILWAENYLVRAGERFLAAWEALPEWEEPLNLQVKEYCNGLGQWVRASRGWSFESERYFGDKGNEIKECGLMSLLPKNDGGMEIGPVRIDSSRL